MPEFQRVLVANRGEIAIRIFRALTELGKQTIAIYSEEDSLSLHRQKADEAYLVGVGKGPIGAYLDMESIVELAVKHNVDAIHPGYGFLAENAAFARLCRERGIAFIGPRPEHLDMFGDKVAARRMAIEAGLPVTQGTESPVASVEEALTIAGQIGYPVIIKAVSGGGGRGMRVVRSESELRESIERASSEAKAAFGDASVYLEKYIERPRHIEVQVIADSYGSVVHLFERDCSIQRRHQKVVEIAPSLALTDSQRQEICGAAVRLLARVGYVNAGTVEFLVDQEGRYYFMEVNPRIQVEHTITEMITGLDIVQAQILIAQGARLDQAIGAPSQAQIERRGYAIQCRVTTEDPTNNFMPDTGRILAYRSPGGYGVRLDGGNSFAGAVVTPHYDSLLVKVITWGLTFGAASAKMDRCLREYRIRGVKTNIPFLENVVSHPQFLAGNLDTDFLTRYPELFTFPTRRDRGTKVLKYIGNVVVNGGPGVPKGAKKPSVVKVEVPAASGPIPNGARQILLREGPEQFAAWVAGQKRLLLTDTTMRDAHQSLLATRMRTRDLRGVAGATARLAPDLFSLEMWGGATFDTALRFLKEDPWDRLAELRERIPNIPFQMLLRGANALGYSNYPDNLVQEFVREAAAAGIDIFRIFDSLNWLPNMQTAITAVREAGRVAEAAFCYTGDITDPNRTKYTLGYYVDLAKQLERAGATIIGIKDMSGLLKPRAASLLIRALKEEVGVPIHLHTHDCAGSAIATLLAASEAGVDIVDAALSSLSGVTSQPSLNALVAALEGSDRATGVDLAHLQKLAEYWQDVRTWYHPWESDLKAGSADVYLHEMPGGQYTNLRQQAGALGLGERWGDVVHAYREANQLLGDIIKVTPSSKAVGDLALFMVKNDLNGENILTRGEELAFPESVIQMLSGLMGQPHGGWPADLQQVVLKNREAITVRPGELLPPIDFDRQAASLEAKIGRAPSRREVLSEIMFPGLVAQLAEHQDEFSDTSVLDTPTFFWGLRPGEETNIEIETGKTLIVKLISIGDLRADGTRDVVFELNGQGREVRIADQKAGGAGIKRRKVAKGEANQLGASMPGKVLKVLVAPGDKVTRGMQLVVTEAMKMETVLAAPRDGIISEVAVKVGDAVETGDLLISLDAAN
ncbi:MAG TPA: pyruvate carboxylase [Symbiobacteriaceae bacterium]|nr:pyruvate carboxylase [Symbiobacteriaceae bacterium]